MKTVLVGPYQGEIGGISKFIFNVKAVLGENVVIYSIVRNPKKSNALKAIKAICKLVAFPLFVFRSYKKIGKIVVITPSFHAFWESILYCVISRMMGKKAVLRYAGDLKWFYQESGGLQKYAIKVALRIPNELLLQSEGIAKFVTTIEGKDLTINILPEFLLELPAVNLSERKHPSNSVHFMFMGGTEAKRKGVVEVVEAIASLSSKPCFERMIFHLIAIPDDVSLSAIEDERNVYVYDFISGDEKSKLMEKADVLLLPSRSEGMPNLILESLSYGLYVITTPVGSIPELITRDVGSFVDFGSADSLQDEVLKLMDSSLHPRYSRELSERYCVKSLNDLIKSSIL